MSDTKEKIILSPGQPDDDVAIDESWASKIAVWENLEHQHLRCLRESNNGYWATIYLRNDPRRDDGGYVVVAGSAVLCRVETRGDVRRFMSGIRS